MQSVMSEGYYEDSKYRVKNNAYEENEILLSYALKGWLQTQASSSTEGIGDLELILKQFKNEKNNELKRGIEECLHYIDDWFRKWNGRK